MANLCSNYITAYGFANDLQAAAEILCPKAAETTLTTKDLEKHLGKLDQHMDDPEFRQTPDQIQGFVGSRWNQVELLPLALSTKFPKLMWILDYIEQGNNVAGRNFYQAGQQLETRTGDANHHPSLCSPDPNSLYENIDEQVQQIEATPRHSIIHHEYRFTNDQNETETFWATSELAALVQFALEDEYCSLDANLDTWHKDVQKQQTFTTIDLGVELGKPTETHWTLTTTGQTKMMIEDPACLVIISTYLTEQL